MTSQQTASRQTSSADASRCCQLCAAALEKFVVPDRLTLWRCQSCGLYQYGVVPEDSAYAAHYHGGYGRRRKQKMRTAAVRLNRIAAVLDIEKPRMLDIGCSVGCTVEAALQRNWRAGGVDVSEDAVMFCREQGLDCQLIGVDKLPFPDESFDLVTSWHVIEHVADVRETLAEWRRVLRPGGMLVMETPDADCLKVRLKGAKYRRFWAPEHTYTFTYSNLKPFVEQADMEIVRRPMLGRLSDLGPSMAAYALAYQAWQGLRKSAGLSKAFQIFARRPLSDAAQQRRAA